MSLKVKKHFFEIVFLSFDFGKPTLSVRSLPYLLHFQATVLFCQGGNQGRDHNPMPKAKNAHIIIDLFSSKGNWLCYRKTYG